MLNGFAYEKRIKDEKIISERIKKQSYNKDISHRRMQTLSSNHQRRLDKLISTVYYKKNKKKNEMNHKQANGYSFSESFYKNRIDFNYKMDTSQNISTPCFKFSYPNQKVRIEKAIENNKFLSTEYSPNKPHIFRERNPELDIQKSMRFANKYVNLPEKSKTIEALKQSTNTENQKAYNDDDNDDDEDQLTDSHNNVISFKENEYQKEYRILTSVGNTRVSTTYSQKRPNSVNKFYGKSYVDAALDRSEYIQLAKLKEYDKKMNKIIYPTQNTLNKSSSYIDNDKSFQTEKNERIIINDKKGKTEVFEYQFGAGDTDLDDIMLEGHPKKKSNGSLIKNEIEFTKKRSYLAKGLLRKCGVID